MPSENAVNITFEALRDRLFDARSNLGRSARCDLDSGRTNMDFVQAAAAVQIAQELNEIKHILAGREQQDVIEWLQNQRGLPHESGPTIRELVKRWREGR